MKSNRIPWNIAHRGASGFYPENTILAFKEAIRAEADVIEFDLQLTADNHIVVFHDQTVDRIVRTKSNRTIRSYTLVELKKKDVGSWFSQKFTDARIPTLEEVLEKIPKEISMILEIKSKEEKLADLVLDVLDEKKKSLGLGYITVRDINSYNQIRDHSPNHRIGLMQKQNTPQEFIDLIENKGIEIVQIRWRNWSEKEWSSLLQKKIIVSAFFADDIKEYEFLISKNIDGILTNYPFKLTKFLENLRTRGKD